MNAQQGTKHDTGKLPWGLFPFDAAEQIVKVLQFGAQKYAARNWEKGLTNSRTWEAAQRHLIAWHRGETLDAETGLSHLAHAACEILFALAFEVRGRTDLDDRPGYGREELTGERAPLQTAAPRAP